MNLTITITDSPTPPFEQVRSQIASLIVDGALEEGQRLPPVRQLAGDLRLAPGTV
ncbi:MAG: putative transcriptional regulator, partial [Actinomyces urogenitalis DORA_12]